MGNGPGPIQMRLATYSVNNWLVDVRAAMRITGRGRQYTVQALESCEDYGLLDSVEVAGSQYPMEDEEIREWEEAVDSDGRAGKMLHYDPTGAPERLWFWPGHPVPFLYPCGQIHPDVMEAAHCCWRGSIYVCDRCGAYHPTFEASADCRSCP